MLLLVEAKGAWEESNRKRKIRLRPQAAAAAGDSSVLLNFIYKPLLVCERVAQQAETHNSDC